MQCLVEVLLPRLALRLFTHRFRKQNKFHNVIDSNGLNWPSLTSPSLPKRLSLIQVLILSVKTTEAEEGKDSEDEQTVNLWLERQCWRWGWEPGRFNVLTSTIHGVENLQTRFSGHSLTGSGIQFIDWNMQSQVKRRLASWGLPS